MVVLEFLPTACAKPDGLWLSRQTFTYVILLYLRTSGEISLAGEDVVELLQADGTATVLVHLATPTRTSKKAWDT